MKIGLLTNVGPKATEFYLSRLDYVETCKLSFYKIIFLFQKENRKFLQEEIEAAARMLKIIGCTHASIPCFSLHEIAREAFLKANLIPIDVRDNDIGQHKFGMMGTDWVRDFIPHSFYPKKQQKLHDLITTKLIDEDPNENDLKFLQECVDDMMEQGAEKIIIGCTDLYFCSELKGNFVNLPETHVNQIRELIR